MRTSCKKDREVEELRHELIDLERRCLKMFELLMDATRSNRDVLLQHKHRGDIVMLDDAQVLPLRFVMEDDDE